MCIRDRPNIYLFIRTVRHIATTIRVNLNFISDQNSNNWYRWPWGTATREPDRKIRIGFNDLGTPFHIDQTLRLHSPPSTTAELVNANIVSAADVANYVITGSRIAARRHTSGEVSSAKHLYYGPILAMTISITRLL